MKQPTHRSALATILVALTALALADAAASLANTRKLTFDERVKAQQAIEQVYWNHRIWPDQNHRAKPTLGEVLPESAIRAKVGNYLSLSDDLASRGNPISEQRLRKEMNRMVAETRAPRVLHELFAALGDDPLVIEETLVRQKLVARLAAGPSADGQSTGDELASIGRTNLGTAAVTESLTAATATAGSCVPDTWTPTSTSPGVPVARLYHTAVWTGTEMIIWGGTGYASGRLDSGGRYDPATDSWALTSTTGAPAARQTHIAVWTGTEMIVWGGNTGVGSVNSGGRYNPATDIWVPTTTTGAPQARTMNTAVVWTGREMVVWGGVVPPGSYSNTGGRYDPSTDVWVPTAATGAPQARAYHTAVWTGTEMVVWGGVGVGGIHTNTGGRYNPATDTWVPTTIAGAPEAREEHTAVWTGTEMLVWGGYKLGADLNSGGRYVPATDHWAPTSFIGAPSARESATAVWTGTAMVVWGGHTGTGDVNTGARYDPATDIWAPTTATGAPDARSYHTAVWTGTEMIIWGGSPLYPYGAYFNTGGRYCPVCDDGNACTSDTYDPSVGCVYTPTTGMPCDDRRACTILDVCDAAACVGQPLAPGDPCDDGNACTANEVCDPVGSCGGGQPVSCDDGDLCTIDACKPASGCSHTPTNCDDGNTCTTDSCDPATGSCVHTLKASGTPCDDGNVCTTDDTCDSTGHCIPGPPKQCDDGNPCTLDQCLSFGCGHTPISCDDHNACTTDLCYPPTGCRHYPYLCDDGNVCNGVETCDPQGYGNCRPGVPLACDDGNICTYDYCYYTGCHHDPRPWLCDDGNVCNGVETCNPASGCVAGTPLACNDGNNCTDDSCDAAIGCFLVNNHSCDASPQGLGYWKRLCEGPVQGETLTNYDVACVNDACTFSAVASVADLCDRLYASPAGDKCEQGEAELLALQLNVCRLRVDDDQAAEAKKCTSQTSVGGIRAEADSLLCSPARDENMCMTARCECQAVNEGRAF